jgi:hypothetical protein
MLQKFQASLKLMISPEVLSAYAKIQLALTLCQMCLCGLQLKLTDEAFTLYQILLLFVSFGFK